MRKGGEAWTCFTNSERSMVQRDLKKVKAFCLVALAHVQRHRSQRLATPRIHIIGRGFASVQENSGQRSWVGMQVVSSSQTIRRQHRWQMRRFLRDRGHVNFGA